MCVYTYNICLILIFFFFFQAEDGIRDYKVTGVQTCALPISDFLGAPLQCGPALGRLADPARQHPGQQRRLEQRPDRKSTRLNSSHLVISYAVFCLKKKKKTTRLHFHMCELSATSTHSLS